jgi:VanZ family protein
MKRLSGGKKLLIVLLVLLLAFIWGHSCMPVDASREESSTVLELLRPLLALLVGTENVTLHLVRKLAHFTEFFCLGCVLALLLPFRGRAQLLAGGLGMLTGFIDETIQIFSGRGPAIRDVWLDFSGAAAAILILAAVRLLSKRKVTAA